MLDFSAERAINRHPLTATASTSVAEAIAALAGGQFPEYPGQAMPDEPIGAIGARDCLLVVEACVGKPEEPPQLIGLFSNRDVVRLTASGANLADLTVGEAMTANPLALKESEAQDIFLILRQFRRAKVSHLPTIDDRGGLVGLIDLHSLLQGMKAIEENIVEDQMELICRFRPDGTHTFANEAYCRYFQKPLAEIIGTSFMDLISEPDLSRVQNHFAALSRESPTASIEHRILHPSGEIRTQRRTDRAIFDEGDNLLEFQSVARDITEQKQAQAQLEEKNSELQAIFQAIPDRYFRLDAQGTILSCYAGQSWNLHVPLSELLGKRMSALVPEEVGKEWHRAAQQVLQTRELVILNYSLPLQEGEQWYEARLFPFLEQQIIAIVRNVTEEKQAEKALRRSEELYRTLAENFPNGAVLLFDSNFRYTLANGKGLAAIGLSPEMLVGKNLWEVFSSEVCEIVEPNYRAALAGEENSFELRYSGRIYVVHTLPVKNEIGLIFAGMVVTQDITGLKQVEGEIQKAKDELEMRVEERTAQLRLEILERQGAEEEKSKLIASLQESEARYRAIVEDQTELICRYAPDGTLIFANEAYCRYFGKPRQQLLGQSAFSFMLDEDRGKMAKHRESLFTLASNYPVAIVEYRVALNGEIRTQQWTERAIFDREYRIIEFQALGRDITDRKRAEAELKAREERLLTVIETVADGITFSDGAGYFEIFNSKMEEITGYSKQEANNGGDFLALIYPDPAEHQRAVGGIQEIIHQGGCRDVETTIRAKDGTEKTLLVSTSIVRYQDGVWLLSAYRDISDRKRAQEALAREKTHLAEAQKIAHVGSWELDWTSQEFAWSEETFRIFGLEPESGAPTLNEFLKKLHPEDIHLWEASVSQCIAAGKAQPLKLRILRPYGFVRHLSCNQKPIFNSDGQMVGLFGIFLDVTERHKAEENLRQSKLLIQRIADTLPQILYLYEIKNQHYIYVNRQSVEILGYSPEEMQEDRLQFFSDKLHPDDRAIFEEIYRHFPGIPDGEVLETEYRMKHANGSWRWLRNRDVVFTRRRDGRPEQILGTAQDITDRKKAEEALRHSEGRLHAIVTNISDAIAIVDRFGVVRFANPAAGKLFGRATENLVGCDLGVPIAVDNASELTIIRPGGEIGIGEMCVVPTDWEGEAAYLLSLRDITERRKAEEALRESEERFRQLAENVQDVFWLISPDFNQLFYLSPTYEKIWGHPRQKVCAQPSKWIETVHPEDREAVTASLARALEGSSTSLEYRIVRADGTACWIWDRAFPIKNELGKVYRIARICEEIGDRKEAESQIRASLREKELLLKEIHHRVKNNMQVIGSMLQLQAQYIDDPQTVDMFEESQSRIRSMALIHEQLYQSPTLDRIDFAEYLSSLVNNLLQSFGSPENSIQVESKVENLPLNIETSIPCGLIVNELVSNSLKYAFFQKKTGKIKINFYPEKAESALGQGDSIQLVLAIADNGVGLPEDFDLEKTETLGLRLVRMLVRQLEGTLAADSSASGTNFQIKFSELKYRRRL